MFASCALNTDMLIAGWPLYTRKRLPLALGVDDLGDLREQDRRAHLARDDDACRICGEVSAPVDPHDRLRRVVVIWCRPAPRRWRCAAPCTTWSTVRPSAVSLTGSTRTWICRVTLPPSIDAADAFHALEALLHDLLGEQSSGRAASRPLPIRANERDRLVVFTTAALHHRVLDVARKACADLRDLVAHFLQRAVLVDFERNSTQVSRAPSSERESRRLIPATVLTAFSMGLARSFSTCSGEAPG